MSDPVEEGQYAMVMVRVISFDDARYYGSQARCQLIGKDRKTLPGVAVWIDRGALLTTSDVRDRVLKKLGDVQ